MPRGPRCSQWPSSRPWLCIGFTVRCFPSPVSSPATPACGPQTREGLISSRKASPGYKVSPSHPSRVPSQKQVTVASALRTPHPPPRGRALFPSELGRSPRGHRPRQLRRAHPEWSPRRQLGSENSTDGKALVRGDCGCRVCDVLLSCRAPQSPEMEFRSCAREEAQRCLCEDLPLVESSLHPP